LVLAPSWEERDPEDPVDTADSKTRILLVKRSMCMKTTARYEGNREGNAYIASPTTQYVAYQKLTSPPNRPPGGGYHGIARMNTLTASENIIAAYQARNSVLSIPNRVRLRRIRRSPKVVRNEKTLEG